MSEANSADTLRAMIAAAPAIASLHVTLLRPLAVLRTVAMPNMARDVAERVLARDWDRHVIGLLQAPHTVAAERTDRGQWRAAFAPTTALESITLIAEEHGWPPAEMGTADDVLAGAVRVLAAADARSAELVVVVCDGDRPTDAVHLRDGAPWVGRRFLSDASHADVIAFARSGTARDTAVVILGGGESAAHLARSLGAEGVRARLISTGVGREVSSAVTFAALSTLVPSLQLPLRAGTAQVLVARRSRHITRWLTIAAAAALVSAFALEKWRVHAELRELVATRAALATKVSAAVQVRMQAESAGEIAAELAERERVASRTGGVLAAVTLALPEDASLAALAIAGDSVMMEGESRRTAGVYEALRGVPVLNEVKLAAPLRQERQGGASDIALERFAFSARVRGAATSVQAAGSTGGAR